MGRGGARINAGRKSTWHNSETVTIRVPKVFAAELLKMARILDRRSVEPISKPRRCRSRKPQQQLELWEEI